MNSLGYEFLIFLAIALIIAVICLWPNSRKKPNDEINASKKEGKENRRDIVKFQSSEDDTKKQ